MDVRLEWYISGWSVPAGDTAAEARGEKQMSDKPTADTEVEQEAMATNGEINGKVTDASDDPIPEANVYYRTTGSGSTFYYATETDDSGNYTILSVPPDDYDLRVAKIGYSPAEQPKVTVESGLTTRVDFTLQLSQRKVVAEHSDPYGIGILAQNFSTSGTYYGIEAINRSSHNSGAAIRARAKNAYGLDVTSEGNPAITAESLNDRGILVNAKYTGIDARTGFSRGAAVEGTNQAGSGSGDGVDGEVNSTHPLASGVEGFAAAESGQANGVRGVTNSPNGRGVYGEAFKDGAYAVFADGWLAAERNVSETGATNLGRHVATFENTSGTSTGDILGLKTNVDDPGQYMNFISFLDSNGQVGQIEGDGSGGITIRGTSADFAEFFPKADPDATFEAGEVVGLADGEVVPVGADPDATLVVSTRPILTGNKPLDEDSADSVALSLVGQVPVQVAAPVASGDTLVVSPAHDGTAVPDHATTSTQPTIGIALRPAEPGEEALTLVSGIDFEDASRAGSAESEPEDRVDRIERENERLREANRRLRDEFEALRERVSAIEGNFQTDSPPAPADD